MFPKCRHLSLCFFSQPHYSSSLTIERRKNRLLCPPFRVQHHNKHIEVLKSFRNVYLLAARSVGLLSAQRTKRKKKSTTFTLTVIKSTSHIVYTGGPAPSPNAEVYVWSWKLKYTSFPDTIYSIPLLYIYVQLYQYTYQTNVWHLYTTRFLASHRYMYCLL